MKKVLPAGKQQWEKVALEHYNLTKTVRSADMHHKERPTGTYEIKKCYSRARDIKEDINRQECIGKSSWNDDNLSEESSEEVSKGFKGTNLLNEYGSPRKPETKKRKTENVAEAIKAIGDSQRVQSEKLINTLNTMSQNYGRRHDNSEVTGLATRMTALEDRFDGVDSKF